MKSLAELQNVDTHFSCGCRDWTITKKDHKGVTEQPEDTFVVHDCRKITVWQIKRGMQRFFRNNTKL